MAPAVPSVRPPTPDTHHHDEFPPDFEDATYSKSAPLTRNASGRNLLSVPFTMSTSGDEDANDGIATPPAQNPFNFQTQVISAGPVKSVSELNFVPSCDAMENCILIVCRTLASVAVTGTNTPAYRHNTRSSRNHPLDRPRSSRLRFPYRR